MKKNTYDFSYAEMLANESYRPAELSMMLKDAAIKLGSCSVEIPEYVREMMYAVVKTTEFLDEIKEKEVEQ